jgi:type II secretory pathway component PulF
VGNFTYTARKDRGVLFTGEVMGDSKAAVVAELRRKGLTVVRLEEKRGVPDLRLLKTASGSAYATRPSSHGSSRP